MGARSGGASRMRRDGPEPRLGHLAGARPPDDAHDLAGAERHLDEGARGAAALGRLVVEQPVERAERQDAHAVAGRDAVLVDRLGHAPDGRGGRLARRRLGRVRPGPAASAGP